MRYATDVKQAVLEKLLRPDSPGVPALSAEYGIPLTTLYGWEQRVRNGAVKQRRMRSATLREKQAILLEAQRLSAEDLGRWLRQKGLHQAQLKQWTQEIEVALDAHEKRPGQNREHEPKLKELERQLGRKDKALAAMSAIIVLKKNWRRCGPTRSAKDEAALRVARSYRRGAAGRGHTQGRTIRRRITPSRECPEASMKPLA